MKEILLLLNETKKERRKLKINDFDFYLTTLILN